MDRAVTEGVTEEELRQVEKKAQETLSKIPKMQGYENALEVKKAYKAVLLNWKV